MWLDNPEARNAMSIAMMHQARHRSKLEDREPNVVVIREEQPLCAGVNLNDVKGILLDPEMGGAMCSWMTTLTKRFAVYLLILSLC